MNFQAATKSVPVTYKNVHQYHISKLIKTMLCSMTLFVIRFTVPEPAAH